MIQIKRQTRGANGQYKILVPKYYDSIYKL